MGTTITQPLAQLTNRIEPILHRRGCAWVRLTPTPTNLNSSNPGNIDRIISGLDFRSSLNKSLSYFQQQIEHLDSTILVQTDDQMLSELEFASI
jgi:hypothetical protein